MRSIICLLLFASLGFGREPQTVKVERIIHYSNGTRMVNQGSGVICGSTSDGKLRAVLTVNHVVGEQGGKVRVWANGYRYGGLVVGSDPRLDVALLLIKGNELERIPDARIWLGSLSSNTAMRGEGFPSGSFRQKAMAPVTFTSDGRLIQSGAAMPGRSGGPVYVVTGSGAPQFVTVASHSDLRTVTIGPYRDQIVRFVQTCSTQGLDFSFNSGGSIDVIPQAPQRQLDGPLVLPESKPEIDARDDLLKELRDLLKQQSRPEPAAVQTAREKPEIDTTADLFHDDANVDVIVTIPLKLRVSVDENGLVSVEQADVK